MGTHMRELSESYLMSTNMAGFRLFSKIFASLCFGLIRIGRVMTNHEKCSTRKKGLAFHKADLLSLLFDW